MKITKEQLKELIKEELENTLIQEGDFDEQTGLPLTAPAFNKCLQDEACRNRVFPVMDQAKEEFFQSLPEIFGPDVADWLSQLITAFFNQKGNPAIMPAYWTIYMKYGLKQ